MSGGVPIQLYRCLGCNRLLNDRRIKKHGSCICGGRMVRGGSPGNIYELLLCIWWTLTLK